VKQQRLNQEPDDRRHQCGEQAPDQRADERLQKQAPADAATGDARAMRSRGHEGSPENARPRSAEYFQYYTAGPIADNEFLGGQRVACYQDDARAARFAMHTSLTPWRRRSFQGNACAWASTALDSLPLSIRMRHGDHSCRRWPPPTKNSAAGFWMWSPRCAGRQTAKRFFEACGPMAWP